MCVIYPLLRLAHGKVDEKHKSDKCTQQPNSCAYNDERPNNNGSYGCNHFVAFSVGLDKQQKKNHKYLPLTLVVSEQAPRLKEPLHKRPCVYLPVDLKDEAILLTH